MLPTETDRAPAPQQPGVWLPLPLAIRVLDCYFGNGPRNSGLTPVAELPPPAQNSGGDPGVSPPRRETYYYGMYPQGLARRPDPTQETL